ncbi:MAG: hypothetical protein KBD64_07060 [Gammaproteobacteria bacterium]|nr:hypothetical protein [Gammaproteobacteria bacterium]
MFDSKPNQEIDPRVRYITCCVLPGHIRDCKSEYLPLYNRAFDFWHELMGHEMRSEKLEDIETKLSSDGYMLFQDIYVLYNSQTGEVVGLFCFDNKSVDNKCTLGQSYFNAYPDCIVQDYILSAKKIMSIGHLLVHPQWRRSQIGIGLSDILVWFMHKRFLDSGMNLMIYFTRNNRGTNDLGKKFGGQAILEHYPYGGLDADIIAVRPEEVVLDCGDPAINKLSESLYANREDARAGDGLVPVVRRPRP